MITKTKSNTSIRDRLSKAVSDLPTTRTRMNYGVLRESVGPLIRVTLDCARIGDLCILADPDHKNKIPAEVVAIRENDALLCPFGPVLGISTQTQVIPTGTPLQVPVGKGLLGQAVDAFGQPLDQSTLDIDQYDWRPIHSAWLNPVERPLIDQVFSTGIRIVDGLATIGVGQRIGVFGEPGAGKSIFLSMIARNADFDVCVIGLIGERGREVREFLDRQVPEETRSKCVVIVSTSDRPPMERVAGTYTATTIAEYFRDQGLKVLLLMDSVTRYARALREVGLAAGEPPARRGFPASVFAEVPRLIERSGRTDKGSITAIFAVLVEGDALGDPIGEEVRSLTDGHIVLSLEKAQSGEYPAIDILASKSRVMDAIVSDEQKAHAAHIRRLLHKYKEVELLVQVGEYQSGSDPVADEAIKKHDQIRTFSTQNVNERTDFKTTQNMLVNLVKP